LKTLLYINPNLVLKFHGNQLVKANLSYCTKCWRTDGFHEWSTITLEWQKWKSWKLKGILLWSILALWWNFRKKY